jgi:hypothetical protein
MNQSTNSPRKLFHCLKDEKGASQGQSNSPKRFKRTENLSILVIHKTWLPKLRVSAKSGLSSSNDVNPASCRGIQKVFDGKPQEIFTNRFYLRKLPPRFKHLAEINAVNGSDVNNQAFSYRKDLELLHSVDPDKVKVSIEHAKNIRSIEDNWNKGKILKNCKENSWKWLTPRDTPTKTVKFKEEM